MQRLLAILVAFAVSATSVAAAESCPTMRVQALKRCCCPPSPQGHARLTCCNSVKANDSGASARDRHDPQVVAVATATSWSVSVVPAALIAAPSQTLLPSAAGPPIVALRI